MFKNKFNQVHPKELVQVLVFWKIDITDLKRKSSV